MPPAHQTKWSYPDLISNGSNIEVCVCVCARMLLVHPHPHPHLHPHLRLHPPCSTTVHNISEPSWSTPQPGPPLSSWVGCS